QRRRQTDVRGIAVRTADCGVLSGLASRRVSRPERLKVAAGQLQAMSRVLRFHVRHLLGKELTMWQYVENLSPRS
ncbi:unnamed protein product, partial [marine sediment metagenome]